MTAAALRAPFLGRGTYGVVLNVSYPGGAAALSGGSAHEAAYTSLK